MAEIAIRTDNLTRDFGHLCAIDNVSLEVPEGVVFGLLGPNGAGKTTMIRLLMGLIEPTAGRATVLGLDTRSDGELIRARTGAMLDSGELYDRLTAAENLDYFGRIFQMATDDRRARSRQLLASLGLWERRDEPIGNWSRGMKQRLSVARALIHRPQLVFLDEPTAGLDPVAASALHDELLTLAAREGVTVFLTTHKLAEAERLCAMIGVLREGRLLAVGPTSDFRSRGGVPTLEVIGSGFTDEVIELLARRREVASIQAQKGRLLVELTDGSAHTSPLINLLVESGADVEEVRKNQASLETVFLHLMQEERNGMPAG